MDENIISLHKYGVNDQNIKKVNLVTILLTLYKLSDQITNFPFTNFNIFLQTLSAESLAFRCLAGIWWCNVFHVPKCYWNTFPSPTVLHKKTVPVSPTRSTTRFLARHLRHLACICNKQKQGSNRDTGQACVDSKGTRHVSTVAHILSRSCWKFTR